MKWVMVLNDGTTYSDLEGSGIIAIPDSVEDHELDAYVAQADGYYVFDGTPPAFSNNGWTDEELSMLEVSGDNYTKCSGCGEMFNNNSGFERMMWAQHKCETNTEEES